MKRYLKAVEGDFHVTLVKLNEETQYMETLEVFMFSVISSNKRYVFENSFYKQAKVFQTQCTKSCKKGEIYHRQYHYCLCS